MFFTSYIKKSCRQLRCQRGFKLIPFSYKTAHDAGEGDGAGALDVIVEAAHRVASGRTLIDGRTCFSRESFY